MAPPTPEALRQWGRDRLAAEGRGRTPATMENPMRQWGRDRLAAEGAQEKWPLVSSLCVNGAATVWPRKAPPDYKMHPGDLLRQWGRDHLAAEGRTRGIGM